MQKLAVYQSLWAMQYHNTSLGYRPHHEVFAEVGQSGFAGLCLDPSIGQLDEFLSLKPMYEEYALGCLVNIFPESMAEIRPMLEFCKEMGAPYANVIGRIFPLTVEGAIPIVRRWLELADDVGMPIKLETHRDCITNDMFFTLQLLDAIPELRLTADLSHYLLNREMSTPISAETQALVQRLLERSDGFQGRISSHEQIQVPISFPQHARWIAVFQDWWERGMRAWQQRAGEDETLIFLCELGPPDYAITDGNGDELSNRFEEALIIKGWAEDIWRGLKREQE